jgi:hypothetical protein
MSNSSGSVGEPLGSSQPYSRKGAGGEDRDRNDEREEVQIEMAGLRKSESLKEDLSH